MNTFFSINNKHNIFYSYQPPGYTLRLESAFLELAQTYYAQMGKKVRVHRDQLTSAHQSLLIRHLFKLGFISEMKFDYNTALKYVSPFIFSLLDYL